MKLDGRMLDWTSSPTGGLMLPLWQRNQSKRSRPRITGRRNCTLLDFLQLFRDVDYYNTHFNPGDPVEIDPDFTPVIEELRMSDEYPESPPDDSDDADDDNPDGIPA